MPWLNQPIGKISVVSPETSTGSVAPATTASSTKSKNFFASLKLARRKTSSSSLPNIGTGEPRSTFRPQATTLPPIPGSPAHPPIWSKHATTAPISTPTSKSQPSSPSTFAPAPSPTLAQRPQPRPSALSKARSLDDIRAAQQHASRSAQTRPPLPSPHPQSPSRPVTPISSAGSEHASSGRTRTMWRTPLGFELPIIPRQDRLRAIRSSPMHPSTHQHRSRQPHPPPLPTQSFPHPLPASATPTIRTAQAPIPTFKATLMSKLPKSLLRADPSRITVILQTATPGSEPVRASYRQLTSSPSHLATYLHHLLPAHMVTPPSSSSSASSTSSHNAQLEPSPPKFSEIIPLFLDRPSAPYPHIILYLCSNAHHTLPASLLAEREWSARLRLILQLREEASYLGLRELGGLCSDELRRMCGDRNQGRSEEAEAGNMFYAM